MAEINSRESTLFAEVCDLAKQNVQWAIIKIPDVDRRSVKQEGIVKNKPIMVGDRFVAIF